MSKQTLEQRRSQHAWKAVQTIKSQPEKSRKDLAGHAKKLPMRIKSSGLGQALAFLNAKLNKDNLLHEQLSLWVLTERCIKAPDSKGLLESLVKGNSDQLRRSTEEVLAWLEWFNRFAEAEGLKADD